MEKENPKNFDVAIIGAGCAGLAAAMYSGRFELKTVVFGEIVGGTIITTDNVENYPGFVRLTGYELAEKLKEHALSYPAVTIIEEKVTDVARENENNGFVLEASSGKYHAKTIIFSTGTEWKKLNIKGEKEFANKGVHYCALCDGAFYKDKVVAVIGGSDSAAKEALLLTQFAKKVFIIYRGEKIRAEPINYKRVMDNKKIEIIYRTNLKEIKGEKNAKSVVLDNPYNGSTELALDGIFVAIGHNVLSALAKNLGVKLNAKDEIIIDRESKTNISGVFAAGDCVDTVFKQAITGVGEAVAASYSAYEYISRKNSIEYHGREKMCN